MTMKPLYYRRYTVYGIIWSVSRKRGGVLVEYPNNKPVWWTWDALMRHTQELWHA